MQTEAIRIQKVSSGAFVNTLDQRMQAYLQEQCGQHRDSLLDSQLEQDRPLFDQCVPSSPRPLVTNHRQCGLDIGTDFRQQN